MVRTKKAAVMARKEKAAKKNRTKKFDKFSKYKKHKKLPLDATSWEELSKNIKGKFKSKSETDDELQNKNQVMVSEDCVNDLNINNLNSSDINNVQLKEVSLKNSHEPKRKRKKKPKIELDMPTKNIIEVENVLKNNQKDISEKLDGNNDCDSSSAKSKEFSPTDQLTKYEKKKLKKQKKKLKFELDTSIKNIKVENVLENSQNDISEKLDGNNDCESSNAKSQEFSPTKQLSKYEKRKLKKQKKKSVDLSSPTSTEKSDTPLLSKSKKLSSKWRLEKNKLFEKKRLERRKELGIMLLPKNIENRLLRIRKALRKKNLPSEEIKRIMRDERGKAQDEFRKSQATQMCFNCRKTGHLVANCPLNEDNKAKSICLKCGSTEHKYAGCKEKIIGFPFATCFICKEQGHISRDCPINEHGIYPKGGKCNLCDSVKHLRKDCPTLKNKKKGSSVTLYTIDNGTSIDDEVMDTEEVTPKVKSVKPKVVTF